MSWCPATNLPHHRKPQSLRVQGGNTGSTQGSHPCTGAVMDGEGQVRGLGLGFPRLGRGDSGSLFTSQCIPRPATVGRVGI